MIELIHDNLPATSAVQVERAETPLADWNKRIIQRVLTADVYDLTRLEDLLNDLEDFPQMIHQEPMVLDKDLQSQFVSIIVSLLELTQTFDGQKLEIFDRYKVYYRIGTIIESYSTFRYMLLTKGTRAKITEMIEDLLSIYSTEGKILDSLISTETAERFRDERKGIDSRAENAKSLAEKITKGIQVTLRTVDEEFVTKGIQRTQKELIEASEKRRGVIKNIIKSDVLADTAIPIPVQHIDEKTTDEFEEVSKDLLETGDMPVVANTSDTQELHKQAEIILGEPVAAAKAALLYVFAGVYPEG